MAHAAAYSFYITGGTVPRDAACYVARKADIELLEGLWQGQFCYVLTARQMGKRIELTDFTSEQAQPLAAGLTYRLDGEVIFLQSSEADGLLKRVLYWTDGHPYLTQRLCSALVEQAPASRPNDALVDRLCNTLFLDNSARECDDNLLFVRERLLRSDVNISGLLYLYRQVWEGRRVPQNETSPLISLLRLSGITRVTGGFLKPRNRIYRHVFHQRWVATNLPDADQQRQRSAYRKGILRALAMSALAVSVNGSNPGGLRYQQF